MKKAKKTNNTKIPKIQIHQKIPGNRIEEEEYWRKKKEESTH